MIPVRCGACGQAYRLSDEKSGLTVKCRACNEPIQVPGDEPDRTRLSSREIFLAVTWGCLLGAVMLGGTTFLAGLAAAQSAVQEAAVAAVHATAFIALYLIARALTEMAGALGRARRG